MKRFFALCLFIALLPLQAHSGLFDDLAQNRNAVPPTMDEAFSFEASVADPHTILAKFNVEEGNYLYRDKIKFVITATPEVTLNEYTLPSAKIKDDEIFGPTEVYFHDLQIPLNLNRGVESQEINLTVHYQGCSDTFNICYPPTKRDILLVLPAVTGAANNISSTTPTVPTSQLDLSEQDRIAHSLAHDNLLEILIGFLGLGLLLSFTPCVFPMIPILSSIIVGEGERITTHRAFILSLTYVLAMSVTYTIAGVLTGLLGENLQSMLQNPWIIGSFSALFVVLSLSMFGLYELQLPHGLQNRLHQMSHQQQGGKLLGVALMGLLSGLIVGPCLAPPLAGALIFIGQQGDPVLGGAALFALSMGMGLPLMIIGTSAGSLLPKAGGWMDNIKAIFGILMLALAIWLLERIIPGWIAMLLWGSLLVVTAIYLGALNTLSIESGGWQKLFKGFGMVMLIYGSLLIIGGASGGHNVWQPLETLAASSSSTNNTAVHKGIEFTQINSLEDLNRQLDQNKPVMLDLYADWCTDCKTMELTTFQDPSVIAAMSGTQALQLDMTDYTDEHKALLKQFGIFGPPTILFFDAQGNEYKQHRLVGAIDAAGFQQHLNKLPSSAL